MEIDSDRRLARFTVTGNLPQSEMFQMIRDMLEHPEFRAGYDALVDLSAVEHTALFGADIQKKAEMDTELLPRIGPVKWAIVATDDAVFGLARMFQILMDESEVEVGTFRERGEAEAWLAER